MKVRDIMNAAVFSCTPDSDLGTVAGIMWNLDCGFVPIVDASGAVVGLITDRDICMAVTARRLAPERIAASQAMSQSVRACRPVRSRAVIRVLRCGSREIGSVIVPESRGIFPCTRAR